MNAAPIKADVISTLATKLDVPADGPVLYVSRDLYCGKPATSVDVWTAKPTRKVCGTRDVVFKPQGTSDVTDETFLGSYTPEAVREALGFVPDGDSCIVIDNPRVN